MGLGKFTPSLHPRDNRGRFRSKGGGSSKKKGSSRRKNKGAKFTPATVGDARVIDSMYNPYTGNTINIIQAPITRAKGRGVIGRIQAANSNAQASHIANAKIDAFIEGRKVHR